MADETSLEPTPDPDGAATPNRDRRHEPPIIEGEAAERPRSADAPVADAAEAVETGAEPPASLAEDPQLRLSSARSSRPILAAAIGALVGAIVAAAGLWLLDQRPAAPEMSARLDNLEKSLTAPSAALGALDKRVGALETAMANAPDKASVEAYSQRISALESAALSAKAAVDANKELLAEAQAARVDAAKALAAASAAAQSASGASAPTAPAEAVPAADTSALEARIGKLEASLASLDRPPVDLAPVNQRLDKLEGALAAPKSETRAPAESAAPSRDWAALAVAAQALSDRLGAGAPFGLEQAALEHLGADPSQLALLQPLAAKGAPTAQSVARHFSGGGAEEFRRRDGSAFRQYEQTGGSDAGRRGRGRRSRRACLADRRRARSRPDWRRHVGLGAPARAGSPSLAAMGGCGPIAACRRQGGAKHSGRSDDSPCGGEELKRADGG